MTGHFVPVTGIEPAMHKALDPKSSVSTYFTTPALVLLEGFEPST